MIRHLYIKNFTLVKELEIDFQSGLNIITGETGAGKSILVNAIAQLCGERGSPDLVRSGERKAIIEIIVDLPAMTSMQSLFGEMELDWPENNLAIIRKEIAASGTTRIFVNDTPATLNRLGRLSELLIDLHGQHQHQQLLHPEYHLLYLDAFGGLQNLTETFANRLQLYRKAVQELQELKDKQIQAYQSRDLYRYQYDELKKAELDPDELERLYAEAKILKNVETIHQLGAALASALYTDEGSASTILTRSENDLHTLAELDDQFAPFKDSLAQAREIIEEIGRFSEQYVSQLEFSPERLEYIHQRISQLEFLLKKYQKKTIAELIDWHHEMNQFLEGNEQFDRLIEEKEGEIREHIRQLTEMGHKLSVRREKTARRFEQRITAVMQKIGMANALFKVNKTVKEQKESPFEVNGSAVAVHKHGFDQIMFELAANVGEGFKPLHKIASGGEVSRIMLALKSVMAEADRMPVLVFDEIDAGISGQIAQQVGKEMALLSRFHQILCVTHLPQIAAFARSHLKVSKYTENGHTFVNASPLSGENRIEELATLLGGQHLSAEAKENARHLLKEAQNMYSG